MFVAMDQLADIKWIIRRATSRVKQLGDRVMCYDIDGVEVKGTVRWISDDSNEHYCTCVYGIEMV